MIRVAFILMAAMMFMPLEHTQAKSDSEKPTVSFKCGDFELHVYKNEKDSSYIEVSNCRWGMGMHCGKSKLQKQPPGYYDEAILVNKRWDGEKEMLILEKIWAGHQANMVKQGGWTLYSSENEKVKVWNSGTKWLLENHTCEGNGIYEAK